MIATLPEEKTELEETTELNLPPTAGSEKMGGLSAMMREDLLGTLKTLWHEHGDIVRLRYSDTFYGCMVVHPDHFRHIMQLNNRNYDKMPTPMNIVIRLLVGNGLLTSDGDFWLRQRRLAQPAFHRKRIAEFGRIMTTATVKMLETWEVSQKRDLQAEMKRLTLEIVGKTLLSMDLTHESYRIDEAVKGVGRDLIDIALSPAGIHTVTDPDLPSMRRINNLVSQLDEIIEFVVSERRKAEDVDHGDLLSMLMMAVDEETGARMDDQQLRDELMTMIVAGHETSAQTLTWMFYCLHNNPDVYQRLIAELDDVLGGRAATMDDYRNLIYTQNVVQETLRFYPPGYSFTRYCKDWDEIDGYDIEPGTAMTLASYYLHRHPDFWEEPERFDPDRFLPDRAKKRNRYAYLPFGTGPRQCIGNIFSMAEMVLITATMLQRFRYEVESGYIAVEEPHVVLAIRDGLPVTLKSLEADDETSLFI